MVNGTKCCGICLCVLSTVFHILFLVAPVWFFCQLTDPSPDLSDTEDDVNIAYALFYRVVDYPYLYSGYYGTNDEYQLYDEGVHAEPFYDSSNPDSTAKLYTLIKVQMIISFPLLLRNFVMLCSEKKMNECPHKFVWMFFVGNWFLCGFIGFITQFMGFLGASLDQCASFLAPYLSMLLAFFNFIYFKNLSKKFDEEEDPFKAPEPSSQNKGGARGGQATIQMSTIGHPKTMAAQPMAMNGQHAMPGQMGFSGNATPEWGMPQNYPANMHMNPVQMNQAFHHQMNAGRGMNPQMAQGPPHGPPQAQGPPHGPPQAQGPPHGPPQAYGPPHGPPQPHAQQYGQGNPPPTQPVPDQSSSQYHDNANQHSTNHQGPEEPPPSYYI